MSKSPSLVESNNINAPQQKPTRKAFRRFLGLFFCALIAQTVHFCSLGNRCSISNITKADRAVVLSKCANIRTPAGPPPSFSAATRVREGSDRWVPGTPPTLLRNAKIWTGARNGTEVVYGDVLLDKGLIVALGYIPPNLLASAKARGGGEMKVLDVAGKWITPGLVDLHSHFSPNWLSPYDETAGNSHKIPVLEWDNFIPWPNPYDLSYELAMAGGVTTAHILPSSTNNIGGQALVIKLRPTAEKSATSMAIELPLTLTHSTNGTDYIRWRHMKHPCGETPDRFNGQTRMDGQWNFRHAYDEARKIRDAQDAFCTKAVAGEWAALEAEGAEFPEELQLESLVDILRGRVKLSFHCYKAVDLDGIVRLSNEFKFPIASFHHTGETYLVPDLLKKTWGGAPSIVLFASNFSKKHEAYRGSEFAPRILADHGIPVVMKSEHPTVNSRYLLFEAQQAHYYGLNPALALASVTSVPACAAGLGHRVGTISEGYDADIVVWDSHPLTLGATPQQVYVDGIAQLSNPYPLEKPAAFQDLPETPNWDREKNDTVHWDGLPPLTGWKIGGHKGRVKLLNVKNLVGFNELSEQEELETVFDDTGKDHGRVVVIEDGRITCVQRPVDPCMSAFGGDDEVVIDLRGGSIGPGLTTYGSPLGLVEIRLEAFTNDGNVLDPLNGGNLPSILAKGGKKGLVRAADGLLFESRNTLLAYRSGVSTAVTAPPGSGFLQGIATAFSVGAPHALAKGAMVQNETSLHVSVSFMVTLPVTLPILVSEQISALRSALFAQDTQDETAWNRVREGEIPLVVSIESADAMATLLSLKYEYEETTGKPLKLTFSGGREAHLIAKDIALAGVSVILTSPRPYHSGIWEERKLLPGPPLSESSNVLTLLDAGVNVAIGVVNESSARNTRFEIAWAALESNGTMSKTQALALATTNLHKALGLIRRRFSIPDLVLYEAGGFLDLQSKVVGVVSAERGVVEVF